MSRSQVANTSVRFASILRFLDECYWRYEILTHLYVVKQDDLLREEEEYREHRRFEHEAKSLSDSILQGADDFVVNLLILQSHLPVRRIFEQ